MLACSRMPEKHTAINIEGHLHTIIQKFNLTDRVVSVTTDNAANMIKAINSIGYRQIPCFAHSLNLVVNHVLVNVNEVQHLRNKISKIVTLTRKSTSTKEQFMSIQTDMGLKPMSLVQDVSTRWNSTFQMFERFLKLKVPLAQFIADHSTSVGMISEEEWVKLNVAMELLQPCYEFTTELSSERFVTSSKIIPMVKLLRRHYLNESRVANAMDCEENMYIEDSTSLDTPAEFKTELAREMYKQIDKRLSVYQNIPVLSMSTILDPRFKLKGFGTESDANRAIILLKEDLTKEGSHDESANVSSSSAVSKKPNSLWAAFDRETGNADNQMSSTNEEIRTWLEEGLQPRDTDPVAWWSELANKCRLPMLYKLAMKYLPAQGTSVPSERVFSSAGRVLSDLRSRLTCENAEMLIFLHHNLNKEGIQQDHIE